MSELHWRQLLFPKLSIVPPQRSPELSRVWWSLSSGSWGSEQELLVEGTYNSAVFLGDLSLPVIRTASKNKDLLTWS